MKLKEIRQIIRKSKFFLNIRITELELENIYILPIIIEIRTLLEAELGQLELKVYFLKVVSVCPS